MSRTHPTLPDGYTVEFAHHRVYTPFMSKFDAEPGLKAKGGETIASIFDTEGNLIVQGHAYCSSEDNYNKKIGRDISLGRALKDLYNRQHYTADPTAGP